MVRNLKRHWGEAPSLIYGTHRVAWSSSDALVIHHQGIVTWNLKPCTYSFSLHYLEPLLVTELKSPLKQGPNWPTELDVLIASNPPSLVSQLALRRCSHDVTRGKKRVGVIYGTGHVGHIVVQRGHQNDLLYPSLSSLATASSLRSLLLLSSLRISSWKSPRSCRSRSNASNSADLDPRKHEHTREEPYQSIS